MRLADKVALVTGASGGIGRGIAERFAREGADVLVHYNRSADEARATCRAVEAAGRRAHMVQADLRKAAEAARLVDATVAHFGRLDVLVNNAGVEKRAAFWDVTEADYDLVMDTNLRAVFFATQAFVRHLRAKGGAAAPRGARVVNISSVHEDLPFPGYAAYCASKGALRMLTRNLAVELRGLDVTVNAVAPGAIETPINSALLRDPTRLDALLGQIPRGRLGQPDDVAAVAVFLASDEAGYVTGATYFVDGGLTWNYEE